MRGKKKMENKKMQVFEDMNMSNILYELDFDIVHESENKSFRQFWWMSGNIKVYVTFKECNEYVHVDIIDDGKLWEDRLESIAFKFDRDGIKRLLCFLIEQTF